MKVASIKSLIRKDVPIYYRRVFSGVLEIELINQTIESQISFTVETKPTGINEVIINAMDQVDYPLLPLVKAVKRFISLLDENDSLPL
jgi:hypothetical protein